MDHCENQRRRYRNGLALAGPQHKSVHTAELAVDTPYHACSAPRALCARGVCRRRTTHLVKPRTTRQIRAPLAKRRIQQIVAISALEAACVVRPHKALRCHGRNARGAPRVGVCRARHVNRPDTTAPSIAASAAGQRISVVSLQAPEITPRSPSIPSRRRVGAARAHRVRSTGAVFQVRPGQARQCRAPRAHGTVHKVTIRALERASGSPPVRPARSSALEAFRIGIRSAVDHKRTRCTGTGAASVASTTVEEIAVSAGVVAPRGPHIRSVWRSAAGLADNVVAFSAG